VKQILLTQDTDKCQAFANIAMDNRFSQKAENFLSTSVTITFLGRNLHAVSQVNTYMSHIDMSHNKARSVDFRWASKK
jgi:hypothetical protein